MTKLADSTPILSRPHTVRGAGKVRIQGGGVVTLRLDGSGHVRVRRGPGDQVRFRGQGLPRHLSADQVVISRAVGDLVIEGHALEIEFHSGNLTALVQGLFEARLEGRGEVESARGERIGWGVRARTFLFDGPRVHATSD